MWMEQSAPSPEPAVCRILRVRKDSEVRFKEPLSYVKNQG